MADVQQAIHVRIRESTHELLAAAVRSITFEDLLLLPLLLHISFNLLKQVSPRRALLAVRRHRLASPRRGCTPHA